MLVSVLSAACVFMLYLSVEQTRTIDAQRKLIRQLVRDSVQLNAMRLQQRPPQHSN